MDNRPFKILSIDGGGIRGVFPAMFLAKIEAELKAKGVEKTQIFQHFDLICGTSTGGIMAIGLALGMPASDIYKLYLDNASTIFGNKKKWPLQKLRYSSHDRSGLENLIREKYKKAHNQNIDPRLKDCKTNVCIPIYDLLNGTPSVLKNNYHSAFTRDFHIPAFKVALATSAAPTYFDPYSTTYKDLHGVENSFANKVDGGMVANNPTLLGIIEAQKAFNKPLNELSVLSIGTGYCKYSDSVKRDRWGIHYWMLKDGKKRLVDLFMQAQSQQVENLVSLMHKGIGRAEADNFIYNRIDAELDETANIELDETNQDKLKRLAEKATREFQVNGNEILTKHFL
jgi:patatin-like phospholipase/acyl hydrolase